MPREVLAFEKLTTYAQEYTLYQGNPQCVQYSINYLLTYLATGQFPTES